MPAKPKLNVKLLRKIQRHITEEPRRFFMADFVALSSDAKKWSRGTSSSDLSPVPPPCGTAHCIAGWINEFIGRSAADTDAACLAIGLVPDPADALGYSPLFYLPKWPKMLRSRYEKAKTPKARAKIACDRINYLIKEGK